MKNVIRLVLIGSFLYLSTGVFGQSLPELLAQCGNKILNEDQLLVEISASVEDKNNDNEVVDQSTIVYYKNGDVFMSKVMDVEQYFLKKEGLALLVDHGSKIASISKLSSEQLSQFNKISPFLESSLFGHELVEVKQAEIGKFSKFEIIINGETYASYVIDIPNNEIVEVVQTKNDLFPDGDKMIDPTIIMKYTYKNTSLDLTFEDYFEQKKSGWVLKDKLADYQLYNHLDAQ